MPSTILRAPQIFRRSYGPVGRALRTLKSVVSSVFHFTAIWSVRKNAFIHGKTQIRFLTLFEDVLRLKKLKLFTLLNSFTLPFAMYRDTPQKHQNMFFTPFTPCTTNIKSNY